MMTLLDAKPPKPKKGIFKYVPLPLLVVLIVALSALVAYSLWDYPEERAVSHFLTELEEGNFQKAYQLWQPSPSYQFSDFMKDWGPEGSYGKIARFEIIHAESKGSSTVQVTVVINGKPPLSLLVDRRSKGLSFSISLSFY